jgi:hypothetical protein
MEPLCFGSYKDSSVNCQLCDDRQRCAEQLVKNILEGKSKRPSLIINLKDI